MKLNDNTDNTKTAAFFDMDKTIVNVFSEQAFALYLMKRGALPFYKVLLIVCAYIVYSLIVVRDYEKLKKKAIYIIMRNQPVKKAEQLFDDFFNSILKKQIFPGIITEIEKHRQAGRKLVIISSAVDLLVSRFLQYLNFDGSFAATLEIKGLNYTGGVSGRIFNGRRKVEAIQEYAAQEHIDLKESYAYGDYVDDQYMLEMVGHPVTINPDRGLRKVALERNWEIRALTTGDIRTQR